MSRAGSGDSLKTGVFTCLNLGGRGRDQKRELSDGPHKALSKKAFLPKGPNWKAGNMCHFLVAIYFRVAQTVIDFILEAKKSRSKEFRGCAHNATVGVAATEQETMSLDSSVPMLSPFKAIFHATLAGAAKPFSAFMKLKKRCTLWVNIALCQPWILASACPFDCVFFCSE